MGRGASEERKAGRDIANLDLRPRVPRRPPNGIGPHVPRSGPFDSNFIADLDQQNRFRLHAARIAPSGIGPHVPGSAPSGIGPHVPHSPAPSGIAPHVPRSPAPTGTEPGPVNSVQQQAAMEPEPSLPPEQSQLIEFENVTSTTSLTARITVQQQPPLKIRFSFTSELSAYSKPPSIEITSRPIRGSDSVDPKRLVEINFNPKESSVSGGSRRTESMPQLVERSSDGQPDSTD